MDVLRIYLRHDQGNIRIIAVQRRVIDDHTARFGSDRCIFLGGVRANRKQRDVPAREIKRIKVFGLQGFVAKAYVRPQRFTAGKGFDLVDRELALCEDVQHFVAHVTGGANDDDIITHWLLP